MTISELETRLRKAKEALDFARDRESEARRALVNASESLKSAKDKKEEIFLALEKAHVAKLKGDYLHTTK